METLLKYDGFLPKNDSESTLYRVNVPAEHGKRLQECIVLLVDVSGSMCFQMENLKKAVLSTVDIIVNRKKIASLEQIVLIPFHSYSQIHSNFKNYADFETVVLQLRSDGGTSYNHPIDELTRLLQQHKRVIAVMFSDGEPTDSHYPRSIEKLKEVASTESLLLHAIGLGVSSTPERILRSLTSVGSTEGYYQSISNVYLRYSHESIDGGEMSAAMNVLVDHFSCSVEAFVNGKRTRCGFIVDAEADHLVVQIGDREVAADVVNASFAQMLEENSFEAILDAFRFLLESYLKTESSSFDRAIAIIENIASLIREMENKIKLTQKEKAAVLAEEKKAKVNSVVGEGGASKLKQLSEIVSEHNKAVQKMLEEDSELLRGVHETKELCARIQETLHKNRNISASVSGEVMDAVAQFRDNSIALKRKNLARFAGKVRTENEKFQNIDQLLQDELDQLVKLEESIVAPKYLEGYSDPITLNDFQDVILHKYGIFMLLINIERHSYGITAPHKTKIIQIGGFSSSVLDVMMKNGDKSVFFNFRGIGFGNAAVPLWISDLHWRKAKHVFGPFVGYAVTGNELEYTNLQGMTLLALILIHLRELEPTEYNQQLIQMVSETLRKVIDKKKWKKVADEISNTFENLNENKIPSVEVFLVFQEFVGIKFARDKALLLLAEQYRRKNVKYIEENFEKLKFSDQDRCNLLIRLFPKIFEKYLDISTSNISLSLNKRSMENYFTALYGGKDAKLLKWFDSFSKKLAPSLSEIASGLEEKQKIAIILSVHKCVCFKWDAIDEIPAGLSCERDYADVLLGWCRKRIAEKQEKLSRQGDEAVLLKILQTEDEAEVESLLRGMKRNSHPWAVMMKVLLLSCKIKRPPKLTVEQWEEHRVELFKKQMETLSIPLHFQMVMFCVFDSLKAEDWISTKMIWRPNRLLRRRIKAMFPDAPTIE